MISVEHLTSQQRLVVPGVDWAGYQSLRAGFGDSNVRITYDRGTVELMSPSDLHERLKKLVDRLLSILAEELELPLRSQGSMTVINEELGRGLEPDECYYIQHEPTVRGRDELDFQTDPPPDLAIEIDVSSSSLNRIEIYASLGIPEVWRFDGHSLWVYVLQPDGEYREADQSPSFPSVPLQKLLDHLALRNEMDEMTWVRSFREWVRQTLRQK